MSRFLVTGATGFLGSHLVATLRAEDHEVVTLSRSGGTSERGVTVRRGDVTDAASVRDAAAGCDGAFHCAGLVSRDPADAEAMFHVHVDGTSTTLEALREAGIRRVVVASTSGTIAVSDDPNAIADEDAPAPVELITRWPYYRSKLYGERAALERNQPGAFDVVCVNPSLLLGPGDDRGSSTEDVRKFLERKLPFCPGGGIAFVDARDAARALWLAFQRGKGGERYLVNAANMTLQAFFGRLERLSGVKAPPVTLPRTTATLAGVGVELLGRAARAVGMRMPVDRISAEMAQYFWYCEPRRAREELGWEARDPGETLSDTIVDLRARGVVWPK
ncbi:MAG TPA: NAD-dependent epimerase/dehydratase family protein [Polyangiaceae bacterium]|jgi:dihydroflavonol-4-reductase|nr:NAD-dependent epimerase/dehydratase family protein [Polyangiaceae bacterium]